jgi:hypothetical protein
MRRGALLVVVAIATAWALFGSAGTAFGATTWTVKVATVNSGQAQSVALTAPTPTSTCTAPVATAKKVTVTWTAIAHASNYGVYQSTTVGGIYTLQATVTTATWTTPSALANGTYFYEVVVNFSTTWASPKSAATVKRTIANSGCT